MIRDEKERKDWRNQKAGQRHKSISGPDGPDVRSETGAMSAPRSGDCPPHCPPPMSAGSSVFILQRI
jgi:hypothetical protein